MSMEITVIGDDRIKAVLNRVAKGMDPKIRAGLDKIADKVKKDAQDYCPVDTGSLRKSIRKEAVARPAGDVWEVGVRAGGYVTNPKSNRIVDYAIHVEFGTRFMQPRAFLRPALRINAPAIKAYISQSLRDDIKEATA